MLDFFVLGKLEGFSVFFSRRPVKSCELIQFMLRMSCVCIFLTNIFTLCIFREVMV